MTSDAANLQSALDWLTQIVGGCFKTYLGQAEDYEVPALSLYGNEGWLAALVERQKPNYQEFTLLTLALVPHVQPYFLTKLIAQHLPNGGDFPEFGGVKVANHRGILPTGETAQFILAGDDIEKRLAVQQLLSNEHWFAQQRILWLEPAPAGEPVMSGRLILDSEIVEQLTIGKVSKPRFSAEFPAEYIETDMTWDDLVLHPGTLRQIHEIKNWVTYHQTLLHDWDMKKKIKPGYRALFYGPPGTGKTLTATLLGKHTSKEVFRIDLSRVVSKYIGETEKNLSRLFDRAESKNWILFFDEADALFGKRTDIRDAHDKFANQEVAYLLQRIEGYGGLVILASNQRGNIDEAFIRRFQTIIHFPMPRPEERYDMWRKAIPKQLEIAEDIQWQQIAARYELSGAAIMNIIHYCAIESLADQSCALTLNQLEAAILREYVKEGKVV
jgi:AAA+ superfamily predicted ATPase